MAVITFLSKDQQEHKVADNQAMTQPNKGMQSTVLKKKTTTLIIKNSVTGHKNTIINDYDFSLPSDL